LCLLSGLPSTGGVLTLPEILFGNSSLQLRHDASGVVLSFTALDALKQWKEDDLPPLKVQVAQTWQAARQQEITKQQAIILEYDWTYTTSYTGSVSWSPPQFASSPSAAAPGVVPAAVSYGATQGNSACKAAVPSLAAAAAAADTSTAHLEHQALSALSALSTAQPKSAAAALQQPDSESCISTTVSTSTSSSSSSKQLPQWHATTQQINRQMLMSKDEPILFYAEVPLYESELDDNGVCQLSVKVGTCSCHFLKSW
jgi:type 2A phosphatase activator TIP41